MEIVINISEDKLKFLQGLKKSGTVGLLVEAVLNGRILPKGHGDLIDVQDAVDNLMEYKEIGIFGNHDKRTILGCIDRIKNHVEPIIIPADKEDEE